MPTYDFRCDDHGDEEIICSMSQRKEQVCSTCGKPMKQVMLKAPRLDQEAMAWAGMPGAIEKQGNRYTKNHRSVDQAHRSAGK
jgi:putative FmdB family regulatory protein